MSFAHEGSPLSADEELAFVQEAAPGLPREAAAHLLDVLYRPLAGRVREHLHGRREGISAPLAVAQPYVVSVSGMPGTGKSTLTAVLARLLERGCTVAKFSLDDLYLSHAARAELARTVHPLFAQRGVPGTHDVGRGLELMRRLLRAAPSERIPLPRFDKLADDPFPEVEWPTCVGRPDVILCDGWFWGARPCEPAALERPVNRREAEEDPDVTWRRAVHRALGSGYPELFGFSDFHVQLLAPDHRASVVWRIEQARQDKLARGRDPGEVEPASIERFLDLFQRVATWPLPCSRGVRVHLSRAHLVDRIEEVAAGDARSLASTASRME